MANTIGTVIIGTITDYSFDNGRVVITGYVQTWSELEYIRDLFANANENTRVERIMGGTWKGIDLTTDYKNWKKAAFDPTEAYDGWHLLLNFKYHPEKARINYYPYTITMFWFKTTDVTGENVGTGDGTTTEFYLDYYPVVPTSETIKIDGVAKTRDTDYTIDYEEGKITFATAPALNDAITADYAYFS